MIIREFKPSEYDQVSQLWREQAELHEGLDSRSLILEASKRNPSLLLIAEEEGDIIGTGFASFDGRLGMIYRLVVHKSYRRKGVASTLVAEIEKRLGELGCQIVGLLVLDKNRVAMNMYERRGYIQLPQVRYMYKELDRPTEM
jgi:ribosomal protein S18 acetylase RimI-like enzyme